MSLQCLTHVSTKHRLHWEEKPTIHENRSSCISYVMETGPHLIVPNLQAVESQRGEATCARPHEGWVTATVQIHTCLTLVFVCDQLCLCLELSCFQALGFCQAPFQCKASPPNTLFLETLSRKAPPTKLLPHSPAHMAPPTSLCHSRFFCCLPNVVAR